MKTAAKPKTSWRLTARIVGWVEAFERLQTPQEWQRFAGHLLTGLGIALVVMSLRRDDIFELYAVAGYFLIFLDSFVFRTNAKERVENFWVASLLVLFPLLLIIPGQAEAAVCPRVYDSALRRLDMTLKLDGFALSRWCMAHGWAVTAVLIVYYALPLAFALGWITSRSRRLLCAAVLGAVVALPCYLLVPACGPSHAFQGWPSPWAKGSSFVPGLPRNCMPSMHFAWALLLALNSRGWLLRTLFWGYVGLMGLATVACGEHYYVDIIFAVPFAVAVQAISGKVWAR